MPDWKTEIKQRLAPLALEPTREAAIVEELAQHLDDCYAELLAGGATEAEAYQQTLAELSGGEILESELRRVERQCAPEPIVFGTNRRTNMIADLWQDLRYGARMLLKQPGFTLIAVLSLALGIGGNTALFSLVDAALLKMLPVKEPQQLVLLRWHSGPKRMPRTVNGEFTRDEATGAQTSTSFSSLTFERLREHNRTLESIFAFTDIGQVNVSLDGQAETASGQLVSGGYYTGLGVQMMLGRHITDADDQATATPVAVISHRYWQNRFGLDPAILGKTVNLNRTPVTIVGVTPPEFRGTLQLGSNPDISLPLALEPLVIGSRRAEPWNWWLPIMGRLKPGVSVEQARAELEVIFQRSALEGYQAMPGNLISKEPPDMPRLKLTSGSQGLTELRERYAQPLRILLLIVGLTLLIACANVANLLLARATVRQKEMAVRMAVGANRVRLLRQLLTESVLLACLGGALGLLLAYWGKDALLALRPWGGGAAIALDLKLDWRVLGFTAAISLLTGLLFGLAPAVRATKVELNDSLKDGIGRGGGSRSMIGKSLVVLQVALSLVLLVGTGLFLRTLRNLQKVDVGFNTENVLLFRADPRGSGYQEGQIPQLAQALLQRISVLPGVQQASFSGSALLSGSYGSQNITVLGRTSESNQADKVWEYRVGAKFFETTETPLLLGRSLTERDNAPAPKVAVINQAFVRRFFPNEDPLGKRFVFGEYSDPKATLDPEKQIEIVGVVRDAKYSTQRQQTPPTIFLPALQNLRRVGQITFVVRTTADPLALIPAAREAVRQVSQSLPLFGFTTVKAQAEERLVQERLFARLTSFFGLLALLLACIGLYGVMSYSMARRTHEIGIRMALGAQPGNILWMVLRETLRLVLSGIVIGLPVALVATRLAAGLLFGLAPNDPLTIGLATLVMIIIAVLAGYLPARRAARLEPLSALHHE